MLQSVLLGKGHGLHRAGLSAADAALRPGGVARHPQRHGGAVAKTPESLGRVLLPARSTQRAMWTANMWCCRVPPQNRCPESGRRSFLWSCEKRLWSVPSKPIFPGARPIAISRISDGVVEAGGCPIEVVYAALR